MTLALAAILARGLGSRSDNYTLGQDTTETINNHGGTTEVQVEVIDSNGHGHSIHIFGVAGGRSRLICVHRA